MIKDRFYEESAISLRSKKESKIYTVFKVFSITLFVLAGIVIITFFSSILGDVIYNEKYTTGARIYVVVSWLLFFLAFFGSGFLLWRLKNRFNVSYDYTFVEDELRITKVFNGKRRKFITKFTGEQMLKIGWYDKPSYETAVRGLDNRKKVRFMTPNKYPAEGKEFYYIVVHTSLERKIFVIECRPIMLEYLVLAAGRNKLERE